jgi:hypothetical protein
MRVRLSWARRRRKRTSDRPMGGAGHFGVTPSVTLTTLALAFDLRLFLAYPVFTHTPNM